MLNVMRFKFDMKTPHSPNYMRLQATKLKNFSYKSALNAIYGLYLFKAPI